MKILGIGNAIVDVICRVDDNFITQNNLTKSTMKLFFDENEFKNLLTNLKIEKTVSGGSVANSIVGISQLGDKAGFIGKISDDEFGSKYEEGLKKENVEYFYSKKKEELPTGTCLILITPDSERTMCTFLGTAGKINENDARQDRRVRSARVPISAKVIADMMNTVGVDRVLTVDLHSESIQGFFDMPADNVYATKIMHDDIKSRSSNDEPILVVSPDAGGVVRARALAKFLGQSDLAIIDKRRATANESEVMNIIGDVAGK